MQKDAVSKLAPQSSSSNLRTRSNWVNAYTRLVIVAGIGVLVYALLHLPGNIGGLWLFMGLGILSELTSIHLFANSRSTVSMSSIVAIASIAAIGPSAGVFVCLVSGITTGITTSLHGKTPSTDRASLWRRTTFNAGMWGIAAGIAGKVYLLAGGEPVLGMHIAVLPLTLAVVVEWVVNAILLIFVVCLQTGQPPLEIWKRDMRWQAPVSIIGGMLGGAFLAIAYGMFELLGVLLVLLPVLSTSYAFRVYKNNMKGYVEELETLNNDLSKTLTALEQSNRELVEANDAVHRLNNELFGSLAKVFDMRDPYVGGHAAQVAVYAVAIATEMGLPSEQIELIRQAAYLHDIGKLSIPESILHKPGKLSDIEYEFIKKHTDIGGDLLASTEGLKHLAAFVRHHHERWDGSGYPAGLAGEDIPLEARILNLCDSVETMASDRPYHRSMSIDAIVAEVQRCAGSQFDPKVAETFIKVARQQGHDRFIVNSARSVTQQYAASLLANASLANSMFAWVLEREPHPETESAKTG